MNVEVETVITLLVVALIATLLVRVLSGLTLAGLLTTYIVAALGAIGGWIARQRLGLPELYALQLPGGASVAIIWPALGALVAALLSSRLWRPRRTLRRPR
jgi:hypothetical protein